MDRPMDAPDPAADSDLKDLSVDQLWSRLDMDKLLASPAGDQLTSNVSSAELNKESNIF